jgi:UrcA family protein
MYRQQILAGLLATMGVMGATVALTSNAPIVATTTNGQARSVKVQYGDLNLSSPRGQQVLSDRIHAAVDLVCFRPEPRALQQWSQYRKCMETATASAWSQIRWPDEKERLSATSVPVPAPPARVP